MTERKVLRKNVTIYQAIAVNPTWEVSFPQVPFTPDEMIIKAVNWGALGGNNFSIWSTLTNEILFSQSTFAGGSNQAYDIQFSLNKSVSSSFTFKALTTAGDQYNGGAVSLTFQIEFVKYV